MPIDSQQELAVSILKFPADRFGLFLNIASNFLNGPGIKREPISAMPIAKWYGDNGQRLARRRRALESELQAALHGMTSSHGRQRDLHKDKLCALLGMRPDLADELANNFISNPDEQVRLLLYRLNKKIDDELTLDVSEFQPLWPRGKSVASHIHDVALRTADPETRLCVAAQGFGTLNMNPGVIAYWHSGSGSSAASNAYLTPQCNAPDWNEFKWRERRKIREYPCIFKVKNEAKTPLDIGVMSWRDSEGGGRLSLTSVTSGSCGKGGQEYSKEDIEFAVSGQVLIKDGELNPMDSNNLADLRLRFLLPQVFQGREYYFGYMPLLNSGQLRKDAERGEPVMLMEKVSGVKNALERSKAMALSSSDLDTLSSPKIFKSRLVERMVALGYRETDDPKQPGEFKCSHGSDEVTCRVSLLESYYPCTLIGLDKRRECFYLVASTGQSSRFGLSSSGIAELLRRSGLHNALLIDHGLDVFQWFMGGFRVPLGPGREHVRAAFVVGVERDANGYFPAEVHKDLTVRERVM